MNFADYLAQMPSVEHLSGLNVTTTEGKLVHHIPAAAGKLGSLKLYHALAQQFDGALTATAAQQGLVWFAEHVADAHAHAGKHPNIDLLLQVIAQDLQLHLQPVST